MPSPDAAIAQPEADAGLMMMPSEPIDAGTVDSSDAGLVVTGGA